MSECKNANMQRHVRNEKAKNGLHLVLFSLCLFVLLDISFCSMVTLTLKKRLLTAKSKNFKQSLMKLCKTSKKATLTKHT